MRNREAYMSMFANKTVVVTGGAGFLGSNIVTALIGHAKKIIVIDDLFTGRIEAVPNHPDVEWIHASVVDFQLLGETMEEADIVFHFAARNILLSVEQPYTDFEVNAVGTLNVLLHMKRLQPRIQKMIYASTSSIYGNSPKLPADETLHDVSTPYAASKMSGELLCCSYAKAFHLPVTALRFSNVYGPGQTSANPYCGVVSKFMDFYMKNQPLQIFGDGTQTRDFTFIEDALDAVFAVTTSEHTNGHVFNVGTGIETRINDLASMIKEVVGAPDYPVQYRANRVIDTIYRRSVDVNKLHRLTGWKAQYSLREGIEATWQWFKGGGGT